MRLRHGLPVLMLLISAALLSACGGGDSSATASGSSELSQEDFVAKADAICAKANGAVKNVSASSLSGEAAQVTGLYADMVTDLKALGAPEDEEGYPEFLAAAEAMGKKEHEAKLAAKREDEKKLGELGGEIGPLLERFESAAKDLGLKECSKGPPEPSAPREGPEGAGLEAELETPLGKIKE